MVGQPGAPGAMRSSTVISPASLSIISVLNSTPGNMAVSHGSSAVRTKRESRGPSPAWFRAFGVKAAIGLSSGSHSLGKA